MIELRNHIVIGDELALAWGDGEESYIPLKKLRIHCPCAVCQGEPDAMGRVVKPEVSYTERSFELLAMTEVGGYALQLRWADGHSTGIYSYEFLRKIT